MSISLYATIDDINCEGYVSIVRKLAKKFQIPINPKRRKGLMHIHGTGFLEAKNFPDIQKAIYSAHANLTPIGIQGIRDQYDDYTHLGNPRSHTLSLSASLKKSLLYILSGFVPLWVKKIYLGEARVLILPNQTTKIALQLPNSRVIRQGIDTQTFHAMPRPQGPLRIGYVGHLSSAKGIIEAVKAMKGIAAERHLYLSFTNPTANRYFRKIDQDIIIHEFSKNMRKTYNFLDVVILPFRHGASAIANPFVLLEAMACERAIITTDLPHLREIGGNTLIYADSLDSENLNKHIKRLIHNKKRRASLGREARKRIIKYYDERTMFHAYEKLYKEFSQKKN